jgi:hypothetical protein
MTGRRPPNLLGGSVRRREENTGVLGEQNAEANLVGFVRHGYLTPSMLSKAYTRFVLFCEKSRLVPLQALILG